MSDEINPELPDGWEKDSEESSPTLCAWFRNGDVLLTIEVDEVEGDADQWRVTLGHRACDPEVNDAYVAKEPALARAEELMLTYKQYVNPTTYTVEIELLRDSEGDLGHFLIQGGSAVGQNTENGVLSTQIVEDK